MAREMDGNSLRAKLYNRWVGFRRWARLLLDPMNSSVLGRVFQGLSFLFIFVSVVGMLIEESVAERILMIESSGGCDPKIKWFVLETCTVVFFSIEVALRLAGTVNIWKFLKEWLNIVDLLAVFPYYVNLILACGDNPSVKTCICAEGTQLGFLRVLRLVRVLRVFKMSRYSTGMQVIGTTISGSIDILLMLFAIVVGASVVFGSFIMILERGDACVPCVPGGETIDTSLADYYCHPLSPSREACFESINSSRGGDSGRLDLTTHEGTCGRRYCYEVDGVQRTSRFQDVTDGVYWGKQLALCM